MAEVEVFKARRKEQKKRSARLEDFLFTLRLIVSNKIAFVGLLITLVYFAIAVIDYIDPRWLGVSNLSSALNFLHGKSYYPSATLVLPPTLSHGWYYWLGTTEYGIPILPDMLAALKVDLTLSVEIVLTGALIGLILGTVSAYYGGLIDEAMMRITDIFFSIPALILALAIAFIIGLTFTNIALAFIIVWWPIYARLGRSLTLSIKNMNFIEAANAAGSSSVRNIFYHVIPGVLSPLFVQFSLDIGTVVQLFAALEFLGVVPVDPFLPELGRMMVWGESYLIFGKWWAVLIPAIFLMIFTVSVSLLGDGLRDVLDPRQRR
ncbi:ABC transport system permease protein P1P2A1A2 [Thermoplasma volcanium GSS1]|uniref:ABC transport system permease protein P1P2A1A2 n=1 Tax=Thermoplasma volcanium (strain ATCC 51530 / DSM 4299 / JCM 9571 / NBRC 15438 / GSS1) TaxID=273116 RepID=Q978R1_THEVO|nr:ABC transporter permease [Thermoplasma volcanium]BAB60496.1 ABC transport system permease protein P1P2A1A2 [Thermoplasma volcanium GSS1]